METESSDLGYKNRTIINIHSVLPNMKPQNILGI